MFEVGFSKISGYRSCQKKHDYAYNQNLQAKRRPAPLLRGTILHEMLEARDAGGGGATILDEYERKYAALFEEEREFYGETFIEDIWRIYKGYCREYADDDWQVLSLEEEVRTQLTPKIEFVGHIDLRVRTSQDRRKWMVDRKSHKVIPTAEERFNNYQLLLYVWAWNREHPRDRIDGIIWDYLRTKPPTLPEVLKKGGLTRRADLDTDVYTYEQAIKSNKLDPEDYAEYLQHLQQRSRNRFYERVQLPAPPKEMVDTVVDEFRQTAEAMRTAKSYPRTMTKWCSHHCEFYALCIAELTGVNAQFVLKDEYEEREDERTDTIE